MYFYSCTTYDVKKTEELKKAKQAAQKSVLVVGKKLPEVVESPVSLVSTVTESALVVGTSVVADAVAVVGDHVDTVVGEAVVVETDDSKADINKMTKTALFKLASEMGIEVDPTSTRNELVKILSK